MKSRSGHALSTMILILATVANAPARAAGELLWEDHSGSVDQAYSVAASGSRIFVAGWAGYPDPNVPDDFRDFLVRAYDAESGALLWRDQTSLGTNDYAAGVVSDGSRVLVVGVGGSDNLDWLIRGYDAQTGALLWENVFDFEGGQDAPRPDAVAVSEGRLFVAGMGNSYTAWIVRAYDASTGTFLWQDQLEDTFAGAESIVALPGRVIVGGFDDSDVASDALVRAYDATDGTLLWQARTSGPFSDNTTLRGLASDGKRVFAGASVANAAGKNDFLVLAYDLETGALAWQDRVDKGGEFDGAFRVTAQARGVYVLGMGGHDCLFEASPPSDCSVLVRAYDSRRGRLLWEKEVGIPKADDGTGFALEVQAGTVYAAYGAGFKSTNAKLLGGDWFVQAYDARTGSLRWEDRHDHGGGPEFPLDLSLLDGRLFVVGRSATAPNVSAFAVRTYDVGESLP